ncbi:MAG: adenosylcobinamide-GDP ribazoletransferase [Alphaproteobacteria bacterium]|nr:adenosylcobinamide-GDP ribazoletransferase [Alphaproteobacteria bacterium]
MDMAHGPFDEFIAATAVLTRVPVGAPAETPGIIAASGWAFPLVGTGVGALCALAFLIAQLLGCAAPVAAVLTVLAGIVITGAFHEDGLADTADGFGGGATREQKLAIMRDSRHGTYGILALLLSVGLRGTALATLGDPIHAGLALVAAHAGSRAALPLLMRSLKPARDDGLGALAGRPGAVVAAIAAVLGALLTIVCLSPVTGVIALALLSAALLAARMLARRQIGGYTGDVLGCFQQIGEIVILLVAAAR